MKKTLLQLREEIDCLDRSIVRLFDRRIKVVKDIAKLKRHHNLSLKDSERESNILKGLCSAHINHLKPFDIKILWKLILSISLARQKGFLGLKTVFPVCVSVIERTPDDALSVIESIRGRAEFVELRLDALTDIPREVPPGVKLILTNRRKDEGGFFEGTEKERVLLLEEASRRLRPYFVDIEWRTDDSLKCRLLDRCGAKLIFSYHNVLETPPVETLFSLLRRMESQRVSIYKLVTKANSVVDSLNVLFFVHKATERGFKVIAHAMGKPGRMSRILGPFFGVPFVYSSFQEGREAAPGQLSLDELELAWLFIESWLNA